MNNENLFVALVFYNMILKSHCCLASYITLLFIIRSRFFQSSFCTVLAVVVTSPLIIIINSHCSCHDLDLPSSMGPSSAEGGYVMTHCNDCSQKSS